MDFSIHREKGKKKDKPFGLKQKEPRKQFKKTRHKGSANWQRAKETGISKIESAVDMVTRAMKEKQEIDYLLMYSWFTCWAFVALVVRYKQKGLHLTGMYKGAKTKFDMHGKPLTYSQIRELLGKPVRCRSLGYYYKQSVVKWNGQSVKLFFSK